MPEPPVETFDLPRTGLSVEARELVVTVRGGKVAERHPLEDIVDVELSVRWNAFGLLLTLGAFVFALVVSVLLGREVRRWLTASIVALAVGLLSMRGRRIAIALADGEVRRAARDPLDECERFVAALRLTIKRRRSGTGTGA
jgi:hypothetical protein